MKRFKYLLLIIPVLLLTGCGSSKIEENPIVTMNIKDYGTIKMELFANEVPNTVANFVTLVEDGFYDNNTIHRVQKDFVIQGGDPTGTGSGDPGYSIRGEFNSNGFTNNFSHERGIISMARGGNDMDSAGSQFFIVITSKYKDSLDGNYAAFGKVIEGMDVVDKINEELGTEENMGMLDKLLTIESATVETFGYNYTVRKINK